MEMNNYENNNLNETNYENTDYTYHYGNSNMMSDNISNENYNNNNTLSYFIKRFLVGFLLVIILIFLLVWLFPTKADLKSNIAGIKEEIIETLNPLYDRIFSDNLNTMKEVAIAYYTTDRLPKKEGETKKLTLGEMLEMKLLLEVKDKNGKMCDLDESYVEVTKEAKEYKMKVNLKCDNEEDYIVVYLGCYDYCLNDVWEKKEETKKVASTKNTGAVKYTGDTTTKTNKVTNIYKTFKKTIIKEVEKIKEVIVITPEKPDKPDEPEKPDVPDTPKEDVYKYLYEKEVSIKHEKEYSDWSDWSANIEYDPNNNNISWGKGELVWNEKVGYKLTKSYVTDKTKPIWQKQVIQIGTYKQWACDEYEYFIDKTTNTTYTTGSAGWVYQGTYVYSKVPDSTSTVKYVFAGMSYTDCGNICDTAPKYKFKKYTRTATKTNTTSSTKESLSVVCKKTVEKNIPLYTTVDQISGYGVKVVENKTYYYHKKTRTVEKEAYTEKKKYTAWSYSKNDETLTSQGYKYTGVYEKVA